MTPFFEIRDDLITTLQAAWPDLLKVYKAPPELLTQVSELPYGWVVRKGPLIRIPEEGSTRNFEAYLATFTVGGRFPRQDAESMEDRRVELVGQLWDALTATVHRAGYGGIELVTQMLEIEDDPSETYFHVDLELRVSFLLERADAV